MSSNGGGELDPGSRAACQTSVTIGHTHRARVVGAQLCGSPSGLLPTLLGLSPGAIQAPGKGAQHPPPWVPSDSRWPLPRLTRTRGDPRAQAPSQHMGSLGHWGQLARGWAGLVGEERPVPGAPGSRRA